MWMQMLGNNFLNSLSLAHIQLIALALRPKEHHTHCI